MKNAIVSIATCLCLGARVAAADPILDQQLCVASENGKADMRTLLKQGANANAVCKNKVANDSFGPLYTAVGSDNFDAVTALLDAGARVDAPDTKYGLTPLFKVTSRPVGELLLRHGASINARNADGLTPFEYLTLRINSKFPAEQAMPVATLLLEHGADVNARNGADGSTPLMTALVLEQPTYASFLLHNHADVNLRNKKGETVLALLIRLESMVVPELAQEYRNFETLLRAEGAKQ